MSFHIDTPSPVQAAFHEAQAMLCAQDVDQLDPIVVRSVVNRLRQQSIEGHQNQSSHLPALSEPTLDILLLQLYYLARNH